MGSLREMVVIRSDFHKCLHISLLCDDYDDISAIGLCISDSAEQLNGLGHAFERRRKIIIHRSLLNSRIDD